MPRPLLPANDGINLIMKNKTILITGGTTGIGLATAKLLSAEGAKIIVTGRNPETLAAVQRELPGVILIKSDSGSLSAAQSLGGEVKKHVHHLDGVFLNAGIATITPFESESSQHSMTASTSMCAALFFDSSRCCRSSAIPVRSCSMRPSGLPSPFLLSQFIARRRLPSAP